MQASTLFTLAIVTLLSLANQAYAHGWQWCIVTVFYQGRSTGETFPTAKKVGRKYGFPGEGKRYAPYKFVCDDQCKCVSAGRPFLTGMRLEGQGHVPKAKHE